MTIYLKKQFYIKSVLNFMFGLFQSKKEKLLKKYNKLLKESYELSNVSRKDSDAKLAEANEILQQIEKLD